MIMLSILSLEQQGGTSCLTVGLPCLVVPDAEKCFISRHLRFGIVS